MQHACAELSAVHPAVVQRFRMQRMVLTLASDEASNIFGRSSKLRQTPRVWSIPLPLLLRPGVGDFHREPNCEIARQPQMFKNRRKSF